MQTKSALIAATQSFDTTTENGMVAHSTSDSKCLDLFTNISAARKMEHKDLVWMLGAALNEDPVLTWKTLFYARDVRGGQGERKVFRACLKILSRWEPENVRKNLVHVPFYGRWDDLLCLVDTDLEKDVFNLISQGLKDPATMGLCAKWMPRQGALAAKIRCALKMSPKVWRKTLVAATKVVETPMCAREWDKIVFEHVPSRAAMIYRNAFAKHDETRYAEYLTQVAKGETKINAQTLYPHELTKKALAGEDSVTLDALWRALPNYLGETGERILPVCDVSGSMAGEPMDVSIGLGLYIAERNVGIFQNAFVTFHSKPTMLYAVGKTLADKARSIAQAEWGGNTNLKKTFDLILKSAQKSKVPEEQMPTTLLILSDMQFDVACEDTGLEMGQKAYAAAGYKFPKIVFWNLQARPGNTPIKMDDNGVCMVAGYSPSILKNLFSGKDFTPYAIFLDTVQSERYARIS